VTLGIPPQLPATDPEEDALRGEVLRGLLSSPKFLPAKLFYDDEGAKLFERITETPEYYLTRSELEILRTNGNEMASLVGPQPAIIEYGSGSGSKTRAILDVLEPSAYLPVDIACAQLGRVAGKIAFEYPKVWVRPVCADYTLPLRLPPMPESARCIAFFPGSTIGNFHPSEAATFLRSIRRTVGTGGGLLLGVDRRKNPAVLDAAYNDAEGVTAAFNLNLLARLNRELGADFHQSAFRHRASYNQDTFRIEMHLESMESQTVHVAGTPIHFERGEMLRTEYSYKYDDAGLYRLASAGGFALRKLWTDAGKNFWVAFLEAKRERLADWRSGRR
jgi:dimethylhistidine N-methyltransferase